LPRNALSLFFAREYRVKTQFYYIMDDSPESISMPKLFNRANTQTAKQTLAIFQEEMMKDKRSVLIYMLCLPLNRLLYIVLLPFIFSYIIQSLITHPHDWERPLLLLGAATIVSILALITNYIGTQRLFHHEERIRTSLVERATRGLLNHSDQFFAGHKVGTMAGDVNTFSSAFIDFSDTVLLQASGIAVNFIASLIIIAFMSPVLLIPLTLVTAWIIWRSLVGTSRRGPIRHHRKVLTAQLNGTIADILGNHQIVRYFANESREMMRVTNDRQQIEAIAMREIDIMQREAIHRQAILFIFQIITMAISVWLFSIGSVSIAALVFAVTYLGRLTGSLFDISPLIRNTEQAFLNAANITEILQETPEIIDDKRATKLVVTGGQVNFEDVSFAYKDNQNDTILSHLTLKVKAGEQVGLAGHSGGGKTTLSKLLLRFADIDSGAITIDSQNIAHVSQESLRSAIAYVPQEPYLFHRSLRDNIAYGKPDASDSDIMRAIQQANATDFVAKLPDGLDTIVGERGVKLSGGQRQRIAIARAILKDAPILILDEATSALDSESEKLIQDALEKLMHGRTAIVIAHRLSTIAKLDRVIVLDDGVITEQGTHTALINENGIYATLWKHQSGGFIKE
jgi:ATP-binding cassette subfamily B protein